jgi:two-component system KDP operon response regulator KdpE
MKHRALHVLVLDGASASRSRLRTLLAAQGHAVVEATDGNTALAVLRRSPTLDVLLLELSLPDMDGFTIIREFRASRSSISIIVVSKRSDEDAIVEALDLGADDYLTKPFGTQELFARIRASLRHRNAASQILRAGALTVNMGDRTVWLAEEKTRVSPTEFTLLSLLMRNAGAVLSNAQIGRIVWGEEVSPQYVRVYVRSLRQKLREPLKRPQYILSKSKIGYTFGQDVEELSNEDGESKAPLELANLKLVTERGSGQLLIDGWPHDVGSTQLTILEILLQHKGRAVSKTLIADYIANGDSTVSLKSIEVYIHRLRRSLRDAGAEVAIGTVKGEGYLISARSEQKRSSNVASRGGSRHLGRVSSMANAKTA